MRDLRIDGLKGFLILAVIWGHIGVLSSMITTADTSLWERFVLHVSVWVPVNYFHMALFFALSILFVQPFSAKLLKKKSLVLLLPYLFWFIWPIRDSLLLHPVEIGWNIIFGNWDHLLSILWFLPACFSVNIYYALYRKYQNRSWRWLFWFAWVTVFILIRSIAPLHAWIPFGVDLAVYLFPYLWMVDQIYQRRSWIQQQSIWYLLLLVPAYLASIRLIDYFEPIKQYSHYWTKIDLAQLNVPFTVPGLFGFMLLSAVICVAFLRLPPLPGLAKIGRYTLPIYLFHLMVLGKLALAFNQTQLFANPWVFCLAMLAVFPTTVFISIGVSKLLSKLSPYAKYIGMVE